MATAPRRADTPLLAREVARAPSAFCSENAIVKGWGWGSWVAAGRGEKRTRDGGRDEVNCTASACACVLHCDSSYCAQGDERTIGNV